MSTISIPDTTQKSCGAFSRWLYHRLVRAGIRIYLLFLAIALTVGKLKYHHQKGPLEEGWKVLLTGTFQADNWVKSHLVPIAQAKGCGGVWVVSASPTPEMSNVTAVYPSRWLTRLMGRTPARMITFVWTALRTRPDVVGGFALFVNGLVTALVAPIIGARSLYFCVGGPIEVMDGGVWTESGPLAKMGTPDPVVEKGLLQAVRGIDYVITMGTQGAEYFQQQGIAGVIQVISGGIDNREFQPSETPGEYDLILSARLTEIKRIDFFLHVVKDVSKKIPDVKAVIVGDGHLRLSLEQLACKLGINQQVKFAGHQRNMGDWFRRAKIFVLTSESEGLSLALMEAMMCGLPAVVSNVGDLGDLVKNGQNGFLVARDLREEFSEQISSLLSDKNKWTQFSQAARKSALVYETNNVVCTWEKLFLSK